MIIIGEKINSTIKSVRDAIEKHDSLFIQDLAEKQCKAGANYIDVNAGMFYDNEPENLEWLVKTVQEGTDAPMAFDSPNPAALEKALKVNKNGKPIINSITDEKERYESILPLILEYNTSVIALCMDDSGMPETIEDRFLVAERLIDKLTSKGVNPCDIYIDPMVRPIGTGSHYGITAIETIRIVKSKYPEVHIACGLSNISFGLPGRKVFNQAFLIAAMTAGLDGAILDPLDKKLMTFLYATEALLGQDEFCMNFLTKYREGVLDI
ncbi:MAG TPA: methyltetrahydrofolate cobalamin methyltransferase [Clostridiales bacterium]|nr:methyltetrahydrofolate cobalamin methyltransferase [Clostridiales bacterium]